MRKLGDSYMYLRNPKEAVKIYKHVVEQENVPEEYYYFYAQALRGVGNYKESKIWLKKLMASILKKNGLKFSMPTKDF